MSMNIPRCSNAYTPWLRSRGNTSFSRLAGRRDQLEHLAVEEVDAPIHQAGAIAAAFSRKPVTRPRRPLRTVP